LNLPIIYVASAGCGKSTTLLNHLEEALEETTPETIIFTTFTNAGAKEAAERARVRFPNYDEAQFRYFRTLHSLAYRNIPNRKMMGFGDYIELGKQLGLHINASRALSSTDGAINRDFSKGDLLLHLDSLMRSRRWTINQAVQNQEATFFSYDEINDFTTAYRSFRRQSSRYDFTDQLELFLENIDNWNPPLTHLFVDECQDLSTLQWEIIRKLSGKVGATVIAGDDKQSIYGFSGGDPDTLIQLEGTRRILETSYRLPSNILGFSETVASRIMNKQDYTVSPNGEGGEVENIKNLYEIEDELAEGTWFLLVRNRKFLQTFEYQLDQLGILYESDSGNGLITPSLLECVKAWIELMKGFHVSAAVVKRIYSMYLRGDTVAHGFKKRLLSIDDDESLSRDSLVDEHGLQNTREWHNAFTLPKGVIEALKRIEERGELDAGVRIRIATIHGVKGKEADNVVILPDMAFLTHRAFGSDPDSEHRVFYVGVTRAKQRLFLHAPLTDKHYQL